jgi:hypothetical protein
MGAKIPAKKFIAALGKDLRPEVKFRALKEAGLKKYGTITVKQAKEITGKYQKEHYLKGQMEGLGTYSSSPKHLLSAMMAPKEDVAAERKLAREAAAAKIEEKRQAVLERRGAVKEQELVQRREKVKERNIARVRSERAGERLNEINKDAVAAQAAPAAKTPAPAPRFVPPPAAGNPMKAIDPFGGDD